MELKACCKERFEPVVQAIRQLQKEKEGLDEPLIVAIDGRCGSGKTTLGEYLEQVFDCNLFRMDDFFLRMEQRTPQRLKETGGNVDYERFEETVLRPIFQKQTVFYQPFSCRKWNLLEGYPVPYKKLNIIEGSYSMHPYFKNPYQLRVFLNISPKDQMENIKKRRFLQSIELPKFTPQQKHIWFCMEAPVFRRIRFAQRFKRAYER